MHGCIPTCLHMCMYMYMHLGANIQLYMHVHMYVNVSVHVYVQVGGAHVRSGTWVSGCHSEPCTNHAKLVNATRLIGRDTNMVGN